MYLICINIWLDNMIAIFIVAMFHMILYFA